VVGVEGMAHPEQERGEPQSDPEHPVLPSARFCGAGGSAPEHPVGAENGVTVSDQRVHGWPT
jgi:hypothetical protein